MLGRRVSFSFSTLTLTTPSAPTIQFFFRRIHSYNIERITTACHRSTPQRLTQTPTQIYIIGHPTMSVFHPKPRPSGTNAHFNALRRQSDLALANSTSSFYSLGTPHVVRSLSRSRSEPESDTGSSDVDRLLPTPPAPIGSGSRSLIESQNQNVIAANLPTEVVDGIMEQAVDTASFKQDKTLNYALVHRSWTPSARRMREESRHHIKLFLEAGARDWLELFRNPDETIAEVQIAKSVEELTICPPEITLATLHEIRRSLQSTVKIVLDVSIKSISSNTIYGILRELFGSENRSLQFLTIKAPEFLTLDLKDVLEKNMLYTLRELIADNVSIQLLELIVASAPKLKILKASWSTFSPLKLASDESNPNPVLSFIRGLSFPRAEPHLRAVPKFRIPLYLSALNLENVSLEQVMSVLIAAERTIVELSLENITGAHGASTEKEIFNTFCPDLTGEEIFHTLCPRIAKISITDVDPLVVKIILADLKNARNISHLTLKTIKATTLAYLPHFPHLLEFDFTTETDQKFIEKILEFSPELRRLKLTLGPKFPHIQHWAVNNLPHKLVSIDVADPLSDKGSERACCLSEAFIIDLLNASPQVERLRLGVILFPEPSGPTMSTLSERGLSEMTYLEVHLASQHFICQLLNASPNVSTFNLRGVTTHPEGNPWTFELRPHLTTVKLDQMKQDVVLAVLKASPNIKSLKLLSPWFQSGDQKPIFTSLSTLKTLEITRVSLDHLISLVKVARTISSLTLTNIEDKPKMKSKFPCVPSLESLRIAHVPKKLVDLALLSVDNSGCKLHSLRLEDIRNLDREWRVRLKGGADVEKRGGPLSWAPRQTNIRTLTIGSGLLESLRFHGLPAKLELHIVLVKKHFRVLQHCKFPKHWSIFVDFLVAMPHRFDWQIVIWLSLKRPAWKLGTTEDTDLDVLSMRDLDLMHFNSVDLNVD